MFFVLFFYFFVFAHWLNWFNNIYTYTLTFASAVLHFIFFVFLLPLEFVFYFPEDIVWKDQ